MLYVEFEGANHNMIELQQGLRYDNNNTLSLDSVYIINCSSYLTISQTCTVLNCKKSNYVYKHGN